MKIAVIGSREWTDKETIQNTIGDWRRELSGYMKIITGGAEGVDKIAEESADYWNIPCTVIKPDWHKLGKAAGMIRNTQIIESADVVLAFWTGCLETSRGTFDGIQKALKMKKELHVYFPREEE